MTTMKAYTDLEQSKKLAKIMPIESVDMFYLVVGNTPRVHVLTEPLSNYSHWENYPCWSLAALLDILKYPSLTQDVENKWSITDWTGAYPKSKYFFNNPVDACVEMIVKLHEQKIL